jgi:hypothetical protein
MGQMSNRSSNRLELRLLGSFRNFAQEAVRSFRKSLTGALRLQSSVYEISEIGLMIGPSMPWKAKFLLRSNTDLQKLTLKEHQNDKLFISGQNRGARQPVSKIVRQLL